MNRLSVEFRIAIILGTVIASFGSLLWINGDSYMGDGYYYGDKVFALGAPLTSLISVYAAHYGPLNKADDLWAIPLIAFLLVAQFVIWAAAIYGIRKLLSPRRA